jgi:hypothetical protein
MMKRKLIYRVMTCLLAVTTFAALAACTSLGEDAGRKSFESQRK